MGSTLMDLRDPEYTVGSHELEGQTISVRVSDPGSMACLDLKCPPGV